MSDHHDGTMPHASLTDVGQRREHNEDAVISRPALIAVADGVGGSARGEVASQTALDAFLTRCDAVSNAGSSNDAIVQMAAAVQLANRSVHDAQLLDDALHGMATTFTAAIVRSGGEFVVGHVGDSRLYVLSAAGTRQVTDDHSVVAELVRSGRLPAEEAAQHPQRNAITRALGPAADVDVDAFVGYIGPGEWLLVCSDGLTEHVADHELSDVVMVNASNPDGAVQALVALANERGGSDNISVAIIQPVPSDVSGEIRVITLDAVEHETGAGEVAQTASIPVQSPAEQSGEIPVLAPLPQPVEAGELPLQSQARPSALRRARMAIVLALLVVAALGAGAYTWSQSYFLTEREDGRVGIDRGFPIAGLAAQLRTSDVLASQLSPSDRERLVTSHRLLSREDAARVLDDLPARVELETFPATPGGIGGNTSGT